MKAIPLALRAVMKRIGVLLLVAVVLQPVMAQRTVTVPAEIRFADLQLRLNNKAIKKIQADVNSLMRSPTYFQRKVDKMNAHFPIIEEVFRQEKLPDEFKYLVLQESALIGDAVSSANAIGYWQFKVPAATEVGLEINRQVDERMHIYYASRGAARYLKKNNLLFDNWIYALMAYNTGPGGAMKRVDSKNFGVKKMDITHKTHWYVLKFLAHMLAFESYVDHKSAPKKLDFITGYAGKTLKDVARKEGLNPEELAVYNRWVRSRVIPGNKDYPVVVPVEQDGNPMILADRKGNNKPEVGEKENTTLSASELVSVNNQYTPGYRFLLAEVSEYPVIERQEGELLINGKEGILSRSGDNVKTLAAKGGISRRKLEKYNDLGNQHAGVIPGKPYYLEKKNRRASVHYHVARPDETWWSVSQRFGIRLKRLLKKNRVEQGEALRAGRIVFLRFRRPARIPVEYQQVPEKKEIVTPPVMVARKHEPEQQPEEKSKPAVEQSLPQQTEGQHDAAPNDRAPETETQTDSSRAVPVAKPDFPGIEDTTRVMVAVKQPGRADYRDEKNRVNAEVESTANPGSPVAKTTPAPPGVDHGNTATEKNGAKEHEVQAGETYYSISRTYGLKVNELLERNNLTIEETLKVGQVLQVGTPTAAASKKAKVIHTVKAGETLYSLSKQYAVSLQDLLQWNNKSSYELNIGEEIIIMSGGSE